MLGTIPIQKAVRKQKNRLALWFRASRLWSGRLLRIEYEMFYTYILESEKNGRLYIGQTSDIEQRLKYHNAGRVKSTKSYRPWKILHYVEFPTRSEAYQFEQKLKNWKNKQRVLEWIARDKKVV